MTLMVFFMGTSGQADHQGSLESMAFFPNFSIQNDNNAWGHPLK
jgi:hypothetical protein